MAWGICQSQITLVDQQVIVLYNHCRHSHITCQSIHKFQRSLSTDYHLLNKSDDTKSFQTKWFRLPGTKLAGPRAVTFTSESTPSASGSPTCEAKASRSSPLSTAEIYGFDHRDHRDHRSRDICTRSGDPLRSLEDPLHKLSE